MIEGTVTLSPVGFSRPRNVTATSSPASAFDPAAGDIATARQASVGSAAHVPLGTNVNFAPSTIFLAASTVRPSVSGTSMAPPPDGETDGPGSAEEAAVA